MSQSKASKKKKAPLIPQATKTSPTEAVKVAKRAGNDNRERAASARRFKNPNYQHLRAALAKASEDPSLLHGVPEASPEKDPKSA